MKNAIQKAAEGGYKVNSKYIEMEEAKSYILLDPLFWQALGKAEG